MATVIYKDERYEIPFTPDFITIEQHADFKSIEQLYFTATREAFPKREEGDDEPLDRDQIDQSKLDEAKEYLIAAVEKVIGGNLQKIPFRLKDDDPVYLEETRFQVGFDTDLSIIRLYMHYINMIQAYRPEVVPYKYIISWWRDKKQTAKVDYTLTGANVRAAISEVTYTSGEVLTLNEWRRRISTAILQKGDPDGNLAVTLDATELSILLRRPGEELPINKADRKKFLDTRKRIFNGAPLTFILDLRFFLANILERSAKIKIIDISLRSRNPSSGGTIKSKPTKGKRTRGRKRRGR